MAIIGLHNGAPWQAFTSAASCRTRPCPSRDAVQQSSADGYAGLGSMDVAIL